MGDLIDKQIVVVIGQKNYNDEELDYLVETLEKEGADLCVASNTLEKALGRLKGYVAPDIKIEDIEPRDFDALIIVGGYGARVYLWDDPTTHEAVRRFAKTGKLIAAINSAAVVLANAGILDGKKATVYPDYDSVLLLEEHGARHVHKNVVTDENVVTANHSRFIAKFTETIIEKLKG